MDLSCLLNASEGDGDVVSDGSTPRPLVHTGKGDIEVQRITASDTSSYDDGAEALRPKSAEDDDTIALMELRGLSLGRFRDGLEMRRSYSPGSGLPAGHRISDSQSSLSSYGSSSSEPHSRASSTTTLSDDRSLLLMPLEETVEEDKLATVQEEISSRQMPVAYGDNCTKSPPTSTSRNRRAGSQKAIRGRQRSDTVPASRSHSRSTLPKSSTAPRPPPLRFSQYDIARKRAISSPLPDSKEPSWPVTSPQKTPAAPQSSLPMMADATSSRMGSAAAHQQRGSPDSAVQDAQAGASSDAPPAKPKCMFTENCDTGASPRKAISHFFGRNKACTLKIPMHVWVHYCRKHYQRIRYRNSKDYSLIQIDLVKTQVKMLQEWSRKNQESGQGLYIKDWVLSLRKREQQRLEGQAGQPSDGTSSVPQWLRHRLGTGYSTEEILSIVERLKSELSDKTLEDIPEIEFLPDIVGTDNSEQGKNTKTRRSNKRKLSQSENPQPAATPGSISAIGRQPGGSPETPFTPRKFRRYGQSSPDFSGGEDYTPGGFESYVGSPGYFTGYPQGSMARAMPSPAVARDAWSNPSEFVRPTQPAMRHPAYLSTDEAAPGQGNTLPPMRGLYQGHPASTTSPDQPTGSQRRPQMADRSYTEPSRTSYFDTRAVVGERQTSPHALNPRQEPLTPGRHIPLTATDASALGAQGRDRHYQRPQLPDRPQTQSYHALPPPHRDGLGIKVPGYDERQPGPMASPFPSYFSSTGALQSPLHGPQPSPQPRYGNDGRPMTLGASPIPPREYEAREPSRQGLRYPTSQPAAGSNELQGQAPTSTPRAAYEQ